MSTSEPASSSLADNAAPIEIPPRKLKVSYLYIADSGNSYSAQVDVLLRKKLSKGIVDKISKRIQYPNGIFVDASGTLYVANEADSGHDTVTAYARGSNRPFRIYRGIGCAADVLAGTDGTVYVADLCGGNAPNAPSAHGKSCVVNGQVHEYAADSTKQIRLLRIHGGPVSLTLDDKNNLYVGYDTPCYYAGQVARYRPGAAKGLDLLPPNTVSFIGGIALDSNGALLVVNEGRAAIDVFTVENMPPSRIIDTGQTFPYHCAFDTRENRLYVTSPYLTDAQHQLPDQSAPLAGLKRPNTVVVLDYTSGKRLFTLKNLVPQWLPTGVAVYPPAPFGAPF